MVKRTLLIPVFLAFAFTSAFAGGAKHPGKVPASALKITQFDIYTDSVAYRPGSKVTFFAEGKLPKNAKIRYTHGADVLQTARLKSDSWTWTVPNDNFKGYLAQVYTTRADGSEVVLATCGIDVSTTWARFPRYGFLADYGANKQPEVVKADVKKLNRLHLNGIQFYDWMFEHQKPFINQPVYSDLFHHKIYLDVVRNYIKGLHSIGSKAMFYDLAYGTFEQGKTEFGVEAPDTAMGWYDKRKDIKPGQKELYWVKYNLPTAKSNLGLMNPANKTWQAHMVKEVREVFDNLDFDGFHIDQIGELTKKQYDFEGNPILIKEGLADFVRAMKQHFPNRLFVANAVSRYGEREMSATGSLEFAYNEVWRDAPDKEKEYTQFLKIIRSNREARGENTYNTVFAAYLHQQDNDKTTPITTFNAPGVLLTEAVIYALGGSHINMSDHMIQGPYFPDRHWKMPQELDEAMVKYYDFLTAYENFLRDDCPQNEPSVTSTAAEVHNWGLDNRGPKPGTITAYTATKGNRQMIQLLNFQQATNTEWRDEYAERLQKEPVLMENLPIALSDNRPVKRVWVATPDALGGVPVTVQFRQQGGVVSFNVPSLKYWSMVVVEHAE